MMSNEAIDFYKTTLAFYEIANVGDASNSEFCQAARVSIEALEKQIELEKIIEDYEGSHCIMLIKGIDLLMEIKERLGLE